MQCSNAIMYWKLVHTVIVGDWTSSGGGGM